MKNIFSLQADKKEVLQNISLFLLIIFTISFIFSGWFAVLYNPQYAYSNEPPKIESFQYFINGDETSRTKSVGIILKKPKPWLWGVTEIVFKMEDTEGSLYFSFSEEKLDEAKLYGETEIKLQDITYKYSEDFMEANYDYCVQEPLKLTDDQNPPIGIIEVREFSQGLKQLRFELKVQINGIKVPIQLECFGDSPYDGLIIYYSLDSLFMEVDHKSKVIYEWNSKGASRYRI